MDAGIDPGVQARDLTDEERAKLATSLLESLHSSAAMLSLYSLDGIDVSYG